MEKTAVYLSPLGKILLAAEEEQITGLWFWGQKYFPQRLEGAPLTQGCPVLEQAKRWLCRYFAGERPEPFQELLLRGTPFQREVWQLLRQIPYGETVTYGELSKVLAGRRGVPRFSAQAVGGAVGRNPISLLVPCHRVVGAGGSLTGYAGGLERKRRLLELERGLLFES